MTKKKVQKKKQPKPGRPSKYSPAYAEEAYKLCLLGATDMQMAMHFEVSKDTLYEWKKAHPDFAEKVKAGKLLADAEVAAGLYKRAIGFQYDEVTFEKIDTGEALEPTEIKTDIYKKKIVTKMVVPDVGAQMNWLKNRQKEYWRDNLEIDLNKMNDDQLSTLLEKLEKKYGTGE